MGDDYDFEADRPDDHDLIVERRNPGDRTGTRAYTKWREVLRIPGPVPGLERQRSKFPITHPWWPYQGHPDNTDCYYDDHVAMFGEIPGYIPRADRGYVPRGKRGKGGERDGEEIDRTREP